MLVAVNCHVREQMTTTKETSTLQNKYNSFHMYNLAKVAQLFI